MDTGLSGFIKKLPLEVFKLKSISEISHDVFVLSFDKKHDFLPGQVVAITVEQTIPPRLYSICSGKDESNISVLFNIKHDGILSPLLAALKEGDAIMVSPPFGAFLGDEKPAWWIAAGTGVAPYRSMLRSGLANNKKLIHGGRTTDSFYFENEMLDAFNENYIRCCSKESGEGLYNGRLTNWLREQQQLPAGQMYYLCGSSEMVVEVRDILISKGVEIDKIMSEIYF
jgi:ferredoxin/flavodoxin---NADP+ reductase